MGSDCTKCPLHTTALDVCMPGRGMGKYLVVGQMPSSADSLEGEIFTGITGAFLNQALIDAGFGVRDVRFTNAVRCETPGGRPPETDEINACRDYLVYEISQAQPKAIIALGDVALRALCKVSGVNNKRGKPLPLHDTFGLTIDVWPTYHPNHVMRTPVLRPTLVADLRRVRDQDRPDEVTIKWQFGTDLAVKQKVAFDIETDYKGTNAVTLLTMAQEGHAVRVAAGADIKNAAMCLNLYFPRTGFDPLVITHNGWNFDIPELQKRGLLRRDFPLGDDTMAMAYVLDETQPLGLESLCVKYLGVKGWKDAKDSPVGTDEFYKYGARDAYYTLKLHEVLEAELGPRKKYVDYILQPMQYALRAMSERGVFISQTAVLEAEEKAWDRRAELLDRLTEYDWMSGRPINPNSNNQINIMLRRLKISTPRTKTGLMSTSQAALEPHKKEPFVKALLDYRTENKRLSTYIEPYTTGTVNGRVHPTYRCFKTDRGDGGTVTGRTSARNPNVQNLDRELKGFFSASPGTCLAQYDYSAIEFRVAGWCAQEQTILAAYAANSNWDPHTAFAKMFYNTDYVTPEMRQVAKSANFSQLYMGNAHTLSNYAARMGVILSGKEAQNLHTEWHRWLPGFKEFYAATSSELRQHGYVETAVLFRRHFGDVKHLSASAYEAALRESVNVKVQNLAFAIAARGAYNLYAAGYEVNLFVHDSVGVEFYGSRHCAEKNLHSVETQMCVTPIIDLRTYFGVNFTVPLAIQASYTEG